MKQVDYRFQVEINADIRVDKYLSEKLPDISRSQIKRFIENGSVILNDEVVTKAGEKVILGDNLTISVVENDGDGLVPEELPLDILFEDEHVIVLNKPAGMVVHPGAGNPSGTLVNALLAHYPPIRSVGEGDRPGVVHRLDKETSGVLIFAKTQKAYHWLVKQFKQRDTQKTYHALVDGHPATPTGRIEAPILRDPKARTQMAVGLQGTGKSAVSEYFQLERYKDHTLLEVHPITGRTHQIRLHLSYIGVPVVGDTVYGRRNPSLPLDSFFLHAKTLAIKLVGDRVQRTFEAPLPRNLTVILNTLRETEGYKHEEH
ncbi:MAG: RluA family pseudouridine synthase [Chloroflexota bacterium]|jgi:23S rRNA pseudouridine1911/1915/1917 synthase|nr:RluA family pseudouridine synthase [Chloroflexota bacterium]